MVMHTEMIQENLFFYLIKSFLKEFNYLLCNMYGGCALKESHVPIFKVNFSNPAVEESIFNAIVLVLTLLILKFIA